MDWNNTQEVMKKRQQAIQAGYKSDDVDAFISKQRGLQQAAEVVRSGNMQLSDLPSDQRVAVASQIQRSGGQIKPKKDPKKEDGLNATLNLIQNLEKHYQSGGGAEYDVGPVNRIAGVVKGLQGKVGLNDAAKLYGNEKSGFAATLKSLTGDTGVFTDQDYARLSKLLPGLGATRGEATGAFNDLRSQLSAKYGETDTKTTINSKGKPASDILKDGTNFLLGKAINIARDNGTGIRSRMESGDLQKNDQMAAQLEHQAQNTTDPQQRVSLLRSANDIRRGVSTETNDIRQSFSPDVKDNIAGRSLLGAAQIAGAAEIPGGVASVTKTAGNIINILKNPLGFAAAKREAAITAADSAGASFKGDHLLDALTKASKNISPADKTKFDTFIETAKQMYKGKNLTTKEVVDLNSAANSAYTSAGKAGKTAKAVFNKELGDILKEGLRDSAPDVAKANQLFSKIYGAQKFTGKVPGMAATAATTAGGYALIDKLRGR